MGMILDQVGNSLMDAVIAGMKVVRADQGKITSFSVKPADNTLVTPTDFRSQAAMIECLKTWGAYGYAIHAEESDAPTEDTQFVFFVDGLDGTGAFADGAATSTVIGALYDRKVKRVVKCYIGEPATGRLWYAQEKMPTRLQWQNTSAEMGFDGGAMGLGWPDRKRGMDSNSRIYLDILRGYKGILTNEQLLQLFASLYNEAKIQTLGSNGLIQALVANGAPNVAGSISAAKGGPWDYCGALLVTQAGGKCRGFRKDSGKLVLHDPLDVVGCDILVTANSEPIAEYLSQKVLALF